MPDDYYLSPSDLARLIEAAHDPIVQQILNEPGKSSVP
jgi:hypothetical protein